MSRASIAKIKRHLQIKRYDPERRAKTRSIVHIKPATIEKGS